MTHYHLFPLFAHSEQQLFYIAYHFNQLYELPCQWMCNDIARFVLVHSHFTQTPFRSLSLFNNHHVCQELTFCSSVSSFNLFAHPTIASVLIKTPLKDICITDRHSIGLYIVAGYCTLDQSIWMSTVSLLTPNFFIQTNLLIVTIRIKTITAAPTMIIIMAGTKVLIGK